MPDLVKYPAKGMKLSQTVSAAYVDMTGLRSIDVSGYKSLTMPTESLDSGTVKTKKPNGYAEPAIIKAEGFYDPVHATFTAFQGLIGTPVATNFKVTYPDAATTAEVYSGVGFTINKKGSVGDALLADLEIETSGAIA